MTREVFMNTLKHWTDKYLALPGDEPLWETDKMGWLRTCNECFCPLTYVCEKETGIYYDITDWNDAARELDIDMALADHVQQAADCGLGHDSSLREELIKACRLEDDS